MLKKRLEEAGDDFRRDAQNCSEKTEREEMRQNQVVSCGDLFRKKRIHIILLVNLKAIILYFQADIGA